MFDKTTLAVCLVPRFISFPSVFASFFLFQIGNVKEARALATEITSRGSRLYELLGKESEARPQRLRAVAFLEASKKKMAFFCSRYI